MKQTEIGLIPDDWEVKTLNDIGKFIGGGTPNTNNVNYWKGNIPWISSSDISKDSINALIPTRFITKEAVSCSATKLCPKNTILIVSRVGVGKLAISNTEVCTSQDFTNLVCNDNVDENFVAYQLLPKLQHKASGAQGTSIKGITTEEVRALQIPIPPLPEQHRIAKALSDVDALISTTEKLIQKKKNIKQGTMQNLLTGKKRLPGFGSQTKSPTYKQTELGPIPEDWEVKSLGEIAETFTGLTYSPENVYEHGTLVLRSSNIKNEQLCFEDNVFVQMSIPERAFVKENDILICVRNGSKALIGKSAIITKSAVGMAFGAFMTVLRSSIVNQNYLLYVWQSDFVQKQVTDNLGATINQITNADFKKFNVIISPNREEQIAIAIVLSSMDKEIETLNTKLEKYRNLKTAMMQQLLTGKIRL